MGATLTTRRWKIEAQRFTLRGNVGTRRKNGLIRGSKNFFRPISYVSEPLRNRCATFDGKCLACHVTRIVAQEEGCNVANLFGLRVATKGNALPSARLRFFCREDTTGHRCVDAARADAIRPDVLRAVLHRE
jgi:hypothetical protein